MTSLYRLSSLIALATLLVLPVTAEAGGVLDRSFADRGIQSINFGVDRSDGNNGIRVIGSAAGPDGSVGHDANPQLLYVAEAIKLASGALTLALALKSREVSVAWRMLGLAGGALMVVAGAIALAAIAGPAPALGQLVTPVALAGLAATAAWMAGQAQALRRGKLALLAMGLGLTALLALAVPPAGFLAALLALVGWTWLAAAYRRGS